MLHWLDNLVVDDIKKATGWKIGRFLIGRAVQKDIGGDKGILFHFHLLYQTIDDSVAHRPFESSPQLL